MRRALLLLWQGVKLQSAGARHRFATCFRVPPRSMYHTRPRRAAGGTAGHGGGDAGWCCGPGVLFPRARDASTRNDRRAHTHATYLSRLHVPASSELWAAKHTSCAGPPATTHTAGWTSAWRGWRSRVGCDLSRIVMRFMERRRRACVLPVAGVKRHGSSRRGTVSYVWRFLWAM